MKVVYVSIGMSSALHASLELSRRLTDAGHAVTYVSHVDLGERVGAHGHDFRLLVADREHRRQAEEAALSWADLRNPARFLRRLARRRRIRARSVAEREAVEVIRELEPDLLLVDIEMHVVILATAGLGIPTALPIVWMSIFRRPGLPPLHTERRPAETPRERLGEALAWQRLRLETLHMELRRRWARRRRADFFPPVAYDTVEIDDVRAVARAHGFDVRAETSRGHWLRPWTYTRLPILCLNARELDFPHEPPANFLYLGPMVHAERRDLPTDDPSAVAWRAFAEKDDDRPLVYCSLGTYWSADVAFLRRVIEVFARRDDWRLVIGLGGRLDADALLPITSNVLVLKFAPQIEVLRRADAALTHGGIGTINECLLHGVPMVVYSTKFVDQDGCAARLAYHGLGVIGDKDADDDHALEEKIEHALGDRELRRRVTEAGERLAASAQTEDTVRRLEALAGGTIPTVNR